MNLKCYKSKLLLLGEHIILKGAQALAMPLPLYQGCWQWAENHNSIKYPLTDFIIYLSNIEKKGELLANLQLDELKKEVAQGIYFDSNIPIGYGLGSSGAFVAAVYDKFCNAEQKSSDFTLLKKELAQLESFFHGASSGTDPLICYLNQPILITPDSGIETVKIPVADNISGYTIFLLDTKIARKTEPYVTTFLNNCTDENYLQRCLSELIPNSNNAIAAFLQARWSLFFELLHEISYFQFKYFAAMIPDDFREIWLAGLSSNHFKLKLCGAGGGGFILGITTKFEQLQTDYAHLDFQAVYSY